MRVLRSLWFWIAVWVASVGGGFIASWCRPSLDLVFIAIPPAFAFVSLIAGVAILTFIARGTTRL